MTDLPEGFVGGMNAGLHITLIILGIGARPYFLDILRSCIVLDKRADQKLLSKRTEFISLSVA